MPHPVEGRLELGFSAGSDVDECHFENHACDPGRLAGMGGLRAVVIGTVAVLGLGACSQARPNAQPASSPAATSSAALSSRAFTRIPASSKPAATAPTSIAAAPKPSGRPAPAGLPLPYDTGAANQVITVTTGAYGNTQASLQAWTRSKAGWLKHGPPVPAWLGYAGFSTHAREGFTGTPVGSFTLTHAFGNNANPGTRLPYFQADANDWWNGDSASPGYNTHQHCAAGQCPFRTRESENLSQAGWVYGYAAVIDYNTPAVPGRGSAFFLHVTENHPTQGCVSVAATALIELLRWLDPAQHPRILMGVT